MSRASKIRRRGILANSIKVPSKLIILAPCRVWYWTCFAPRAPRIAYLDSRAAYLVPGSRFGSLVRGPWPAKSCGLNWVTLAVWRRWAAEGIAGAGACVNLSPASAGIPSPNPLLLLLLLISRIRLDTNCSNIFLCFALLAFSRRTKSQV